MISSHLHIKKLLQSCLRHTKQGVSHVFENNFFPKIFEAVSDEQAERFHQDI